MSALKTDFGGDRGDLFILMLRTSFLTVVTLGIYRFWRTTRLRRWYWSSIRPGGVAMEYTGTPQEKLAGFLVAVIVLAVYVALFNLAGLFVAFNLSDNDLSYMTFAVGAAPLALVPVILAARYRARRYILSRTTWLGIRFGMDGGAWGYSWRACMYWVLTIATLGLFWPLKTFQLEKYLTDRTWYGTARFRQHGSPFMLYLLALPFYVLAAVVVSVTVLIVLETDEVIQGWYALTLPVFTILLLVSGLYFRVASVRAMAELKELGDGLEFGIEPRTRILLRIHFFGNLISVTLVSLVSPVVLGLVVGFFYLIGQVNADAITNPPPNLVAFMAVLTWLTVFILYGVFRQVFVTYPTVRHVAETLEIEEPAVLHGIRQRDADQNREAGGFAEALDVGAAF
jgi:Bacterial protein of unknown function (DUF898)